MSLCVISPRRPRFSDDVKQARLPFHTFYRSCTLTRCRGKPQFLMRDSFMNKCVRWEIYIVLASRSQPTSCAKIFSYASDVNHEHSNTAQPTHATIYSIVAYSVLRAEMKICLRFNCAYVDCVCALKKPPSECICVSVFTAHSDSSIWAI